jgi:two-component system, chemotaxis family, sensor kinase CheA
MDTNNNPVYKLPDEPEVTQDEIRTDQDQKILNDCWHISICPRHNNRSFEYDPRIQIDELEIIGYIKSFRFFKNEMPVIEEFNPGSYYLGLEIDLKSKCNKTEVERKLISLKENFVIRILPPNSNTPGYISLIEDLSDADRMIGEILRKTGTLTDMELTEALTIQKEMADDKALNIEIVPIGELLVEEKMIHEFVLNAALKKQKKIRDRKVY